MMLRRLFLLSLFSLFISSSIAIAKNPNFMHINPTNEHSFGKSDVSGPNVFTPAYYLTVYFNHRTKPKHLKSPGLHPPLYFRFVARDAETRLNIEKSINLLTKNDSYVDLAAIQELKGNAYSKKSAKEILEILRPAFKTRDEYKSPLWTSMKNYFSGGPKCD
jgi:hypothetical protein